MKINNKDYPDDIPEFYKVVIPNYETLQIIPNVGILERRVGLINDLKEDLSLNSLLIIGDFYGSFISKNCNFEKITIHKDHIKPSDLIYVSDSVLMTDHMYNYIKINSNNPIFISPYKILFDNYKTYELTKKCFENTIYYISVPDKFYNLFYDHFKYYINEDKLDYDNLINLCIMVKDAGDLFEKVLTENLPYIDRWTILDTGSTDNTIDIINKVLSVKKGSLVQEPFINFRDSRNRCLELAGTKCKYNIMLDDTYVIRGDLRDFFTKIRGDQYAESYSLIVKSNDLEYSSNRILKSENNLKYIYKIHEVIQHNQNVFIPKDIIYISDYTNDYMEERTIDRKRKDLDLLFEEIKEDPQNPRHYYYIAQTYKLLDEHELAAEYFQKRYDHPIEGFFQEKLDSLFEMTRIYNFKLNKPWEECEQLYLKCYNMDTSRPESLYFIGIHYYLENNYNKAYEYIKAAFEIGYPVDKQFSLKPTLTYYFTPKFLSEICYFIKDYNTGIKASDFFLKHNNPTDDYYETMMNWKNIFSLLDNFKLSTTPITHKSKLICFIADGGYTKWSGKNITTNGVGGSETFIIEMARYIKKLTDYKVVVFCNCDSDIFEGVEYYPLHTLSKFLSENVVDTCLVSRFTQYIPLCINANVNNIYFILHDISPIGNIIPINNKLKKIFCLTEWHKTTFLKNFPQFKNITEVFSYGIDPMYFKQNERKVNNSFIYSSFPNRGLSVVLKMWPRIKNIFPNAVLNIYCDLFGEWVTNNYPEEMREIIDQLWDSYDNKYKGYEQGILYHGWVSKSKLAKAWQNAQYWFYPCKFQETFCLTALEAAASKTLAITNDLAALRYTIGDRGIVIEGDSEIEDWQDRVIKKLEKIKSGEINTQELIQKNYEWAKNITWEARAKFFIEEYVL